MLPSAPSKPVSSPGRELRFGDGHRRRGHPAVRGPTAAPRAVPRGPAEPAADRRPGLGTPLRPTVPGRRRPAHAVAGTRTAPPRRRARALPARVHRRRPHRARPGRRAGHLAPGQRPRGPCRPPARGHPPGAGRRAGGPDDRAGAQPGPDPARAPGARPRSGPSCTGCIAEPPVDDFVDRNEQRHRVWAIRDPELLAAIDEGLAAEPGADRRRPPPLRGLPAHAAALPRRPDRPRPGDARRPGGHPALPRPDPPHPDRRRPRRPGRGRRGGRRRPRRWSTGPPPCTRSARPRWPRPTDAAGRP